MAKQVFVRVVVLVVGQFLGQIALAGTARAEMTGVYDLGPQAAAMILRSDFDEVGAPIGILSFCHRKTLLEKQRCTGASMPIRCKTSPTQWTCEEGGNYPFKAEITTVTEDRIHYKFKSSFNEGDLEGQRLTIDVK